jgi:hypothetical protein
MKKRGPSDDDNFHRRARCFASAGRDITGARRSAVDARPPLAPNASA